VNSGMCHQSDCRGALQVTVVTVTVDLGTAVRMCSLFPRWCIAVGTSAQDGI